MAGDANTPRKASARLLKQQIHSLQLTAGILIKTTRSYKRAGAPNGHLQTEVAGQIGRNQSEISRVENGTLIFPDKDLRKLLVQCGFDLHAPGGRAFFQMLRFLRDHGDNLAQLEDERP